MGLLDGNLDPQSASVLALAGGLLSPGSFGQGLSRGIAGQQQVQMNAQDMDAKRQALEMTKLQYAAALRNQNLINTGLERYMNGGAAPAQSAPSAPSAPSVMAGQGSQPSFMSANPTMGGTAPAPSPAPQGGPMMGGLPFDLGFPELAFNGGKGLAELQMKYNTPTSFRPGGYGVAPNGKMQQFPQVPEGFTALQNADGSWRMERVAGGPEAVAATSTAKASGPAGYKQTKIIGPGGVEYTVFNKDLPGFGGAPSLSPSLPTGSPPTGTRIDPAVQAQRDAEGAQVVASAQEGGPAPASIASGGPNDMAALQAQIVRERAKGNTAGVQILTQQLAQKQGAMPAGAIQTGLAPGVDKGAANAQDTMTESYKAVKAANSSAQTVQARLDQIDQFSKGAILGGDTGWRDQVNNLLSIAHIDDRATDRKTAGDLLDKNASQIALALGTGSQGTDALRSLAAAANPSRHMTQPAINEAVAQLKASAQVQQAKASLLTPLFNASNPAPYNTAEQQFDKNADYRVFQIAKDTQGMSAPQIQAYFQAKGYTPQQIVQLQAQRKALLGLGVQF